MIQSNIHLIQSSIHPASTMPPSWPLLALWQMPNTEGYIEPGKKRAKKNIDVELWGLWGKDKASPLKPEVPALPLLPLLPLQRPPPHCLS